MRVKLSSQKRSHPRAVLAELLGAGTLIETSYRPKRLGLLVQTEASLSGLRQRLHPRWARRLSPVHAPSGRFFLEPSSSYFAKAFQALEPRDFGPGGSACQPCRAFFSRVRLERLRRTTLILEAGESPLGSESKLLRRIMLRIESLPYSRRLDRLWVGLAEDFDFLWEKQHLRGGPGSLRTQAGLSVCQWLWRAGSNAELLRVNASELGEGQDC